MANFTTREEGIEAGIPDTLDGAQLGVQEMNKISRLADFLFSRDTARKRETVLKQAIRLYGKTHEFIRGEWRERNTVRLTGPDKVIVNIKADFLD